MSQDFRTYQETEQTKLFKKYGAFFLFGNQSEIVEKLKAKKQLFLTAGIMNKDDKFCSMGYGLLAPTKNVPKIREGMNLIQKTKVAKDIKDNGINKIIVRELYNYETFVSYDLTDVKEALKPYNVTDEQIQNAFTKEMPIFEAHN